MVFTDLAQLLVERWGDFVRTKIFNSLQQREKVVVQQSVKALAKPCSYLPCSPYRRSVLVLPTLTAAANSEGLRLMVRCTHYSLGGGGLHLKSPALL
jgi:hypothetical protein